MLFWCSLMLSDAPLCSLSAPLCSLVANFCRCRLVTFKDSWTTALCWVRKPPVAPWFNIPSLCFYFLSSALTQLSSSIYGLQSCSHFVIRSDNCISLPSQVLLVTLSALSFSKFTIEKKRTTAQFFDDTITNDHEESAWKRRSSDRVAKWAKNDTEAIFERTLNPWDEWVLCSIHSHNISL